MKVPLPPSQLAQLPAPSAQALAHSQALTRHIEAAIDAAGGWIPFARFMELALYAPGLGYYVAGSRKFGAGGDFVTAPEISPLFGRCLARSVAEVLAQTGGDILEFGPGTGVLARDVLLELERCNALPEHYWLLDLSAELRERQQETLAVLPAPLAARVGWLERLPESFTGVVLANEVLDVLPAHLVTFVEGWAFERGVSRGAQGFQWRDRLIERAPLARLAPEIASRYLGGNPPVGYLTEIAPASMAWVETLTHALGRGMLLLIDYGFRGAEFYHPTRTHGTLMCHYRHFAHTDPFYLPGLQDITAHVDFTALADAAVGAGAEVIGYTTQASFLLDCGLTDMLGCAAASDPVQRLAETGQVQRLVSPAEMGEFFKVLGLGKGVDAAMTGFRGRGLPL